MDLLDRLSYLTTVTFINESNNLPLVERCGIFTGEKIHPALIRGVKLVTKTFIIATFNVQNLFGRAKVFNFRDHSIGDHILGRIDEFSQLVNKKIFTEQDKEQIVSMYTGDLKPYISVRENRGKLFKRKNRKIVGVQADGCRDWDGEIVFKQARFSEVGRKNTGKVIKDTKADIVCIVETENRPTLRSFDAHLLGSRYKHEMLIDANDPRGIDVGLYSRYPIGLIQTHLFDRDGNSPIFSRDCLEVELLMPDGMPLYMLCNHFKSRGYDYSGNAAEKRKKQAVRVAQILDSYDLSRERVVVAGDLNDNPESASLQPLLGIENLYDVLELQFPDHPIKRWTYYYNAFEQIDYLLVSKQLKDNFRKAGVKRGGIYDLYARTSSSGGLVEAETEYSTVTCRKGAASDHGAVWAEFSI